MNSNSKLWIVFGLAVILMFCTLLGIACGAIQRRSNRDNINIAEATPSPTATPFCTVLLDAGHGGFDAGASGVDSHVREDELNLDVTLQTKKILEDNGVCVLLTREDKNALADTKKEDMQKRKEIITGCGADIMVSIHMNKFKDRSIKGPMVFYTDGDMQSQELATALITSLCEGTGTAKRLPNPGDYFVIRVSNVPSCIVECGFLSNPTEESLLCDAEYRKTIAACIAHGILQYITPKYS